MYLLLDENLTTQPGEYYMVSILKTSQKDLGVNLHSSG